MYQLRFPGIAPTSNTRMKQAGGRLYTSKEAKSYQEAVALMAKAAMTKLGLTKPLEGQVAALYFVRLKRGRRDWDSSIKDVQDALNGIVWGDDRQVSMGIGLIDRKADKDEVVVYFAEWRKAGAILALASTISGTLTTGGSDE